MLTKTLAWLCRLLVGVLFIFSGFVKSIDPWGTVFKIQDYLNFIDLPLWPNLVVTGVFLLCILEFLTGVFILTGSFRKSWPWVAAAIMVFMTPLTLWIAIKNPVPDCGCFGDALVISNWATFWKNIVLDIAIVYLILHNREIPPLINPYLQWITFSTSAIYILIIAFYGYSFQPLIDFRQYPVGSTLVSDAEGESGPQYVFVYKKGDEVMEFGINDNLPDEEEGWNFIERKKITEENNFKDDSEFKIWDIEGEEDLTSEALEPDGEELIILSPSLVEVSPATTWKLNALYDWSRENDIRMIAIVAANREEIEQWEDLSMSEYPVYTAEDTQIKQLVRGNPGVVFLKNGVIEWKSSLKAIDIDALIQEGNDTGIYNITNANNIVLLNFTYLYIGAIIFLAVLSLFPALASKLSLSKTGRYVTHDDKTLP